MDTNISLYLRNNKEIAFQRNGMVIGGVRLSDFSPHSPNSALGSMEVYGLGKISKFGPWRCGHFPAKDGVIHFSPTEEGKTEEKRIWGAYRVDDGNISIKLTNFTSDALGAYSAKINLNSYEPTYFHAKSETEIRFVGEKRGRIWSKLKEGTLPYPHYDNHIIPDSVQICGIETMEDIVQVSRQDGDDSYHLEVQFSLKHPQGTASSIIQWKSNSLGEILDQLYSSTPGIEATFRSIDSSIPEGRVSNLIQRLERENKLRQ